MSTDVFLWSIACIGKEFAIDQEHKRRTSVVEEKIRSFLARKQSH